MTTNMDACKLRVLQVAEQVEAAADMPRRQNAQLVANQGAAATAQTASQISQMVAAVMEPLKEQVRAPA